jgi:hypothetical protein
MANRNAVKRKQRAEQRRLDQQQAEQKRMDNARAVMKRGGSEKELNEAIAGPAAKPPAPLLGALAAVFLRGDR